MDSTEAYKGVENLGYSYFYDEVGDFSVGEILAEIQDDIQHTPRSALDFWENTRDAFKATLSECSDQEIRVLLNAFAHSRLTVEAGRLFLTQVYETLVRAIDAHSEFPD